MAWSPTVDGCHVLFDEAWCCWLSIVYGSRSTQVGFDPLGSADDSEGFKLVFLWFVYFILFFLYSHLSGFRWSFRLLYFKFCLYFFYLFSPEGLELFRVQGGTDVVQEELAQVGTHLEVQVRDGDEGDGEDDGDGDNDIELMQVGQHLQTHH